MINKLFGGLVPTITFQGRPAAVESIDFGNGEGTIVVKVQGQRIRIKLGFTEVTLLEDR